MAYEDSTDTKICAHEFCQCEVRQPDAVQDGDDAYCSQGCADGVGCNHPGCKCSGAIGDKPEAVIPPVM